jgi:hypothetical protein
MSCKVFIASSTRAVPLVKWLASALSAKGIEARPWYEVAPPGEFVLDNLIREASQCDFAAVLLTQDDLSGKFAKDGDREPRDNCIFEAGLFTGALGLEKKRCFLFVGVNEKELPSDLKGLVHNKITEPPGLADLATRPFHEPLPSAFSNSCQVAFGDTARVVIGRIQEMGRCRRPGLHILTTGDLIETEQLRHLGGSLHQNSRVLVSSDQPIERGADFADRVLTNMKGYVNYTYVFSAASDLNMVARVIQALAAGKLKTEDLSERKRLMATDPTLIRENLKDLKERLRIYFVEDAPLFHFCIHNVGDLDEAACYLRYPELNLPHFIQWRTGRSVKPIENEIKKPLPLDDDDLHQIFRSTASFDLYGTTHTSVRLQLRRAVLELFPPELQPDIEGACFSASKSAAQ